MQTPEEKQKRYESLTAIYRVCNSAMKLVQEYDPILWSSDEIVNFRGNQVNRDDAMATITAEMAELKPNFEAAIDSL